MSASILREAAAKMRERAEGATDGPWAVPDADDDYVDYDYVVGAGEPGYRYIICEHAGVDAEHIASWHPTVALAVADWLESVARAERHEVNGADISNALTVARAYLGRDS